MIWRNSLQEIAKQLPPSAAQLRLLHFGWGAGLVKLRPDVLPVQAVGPLPSEAFDAVLRYGEPADFWAEDLRVLRAGGRLILLVPLPWFRPSHSPEGIARQMEAGGFVRILAERIWGGRAIMCRGEKPHLAGASTLQRVAVGASDGGGRGRFVHLLVCQSPNKALWQLAPHETLHWDILGIQKEGGFAALGFSALPKAVQFMQAAVLADWVQGINKIAKFSMVTATTWDFPLLLNPDLDTQLQPIFKSLDPQSAEAPDE